MSSSEETLNARLQQRYSVLMALSRDAFADRHLETAYHALAAAMHCARKIRNREFLLEVGECAIEQHAWMYEYAPPHSLSPPLVAEKGSAHPYKVLARSALLAASQLESHTPSGVDVFLSNE